MTPKTDDSYKQWYSRYPRRYQDKTPGLSLAEHGAYTLLLDHYYLTESPLPANRMQLHRICRAIAEEEARAVDTVIASYFVLTPRGYENVTAEEEIAKRRLISEKRSKSASARHSANPDVGCKPDANAPANAPANAENNDATKPANADTLTPTINPSGVVTRELVREVTDKVLDLIPRGHDTPGLVGGGWAMVEVWLTNGADPERDIYPTVTHLLKTTPNPNSLRYFTSAIGRATKTRQQALGDFASSAPDSSGKRHHSTQPKGKTMKEALNAIGVQSVLDRTASNV